MENNENNSWTLNPIFIVLGMLFIVIIPILIWSKQAYLQQISHASGIVITSAKTQSIQTAIDGVINTVLVKEGENVNQGQEIIVLDKIQTQAAYESSFAKVAALNATLVRVKSEIYGKPLIFSDEFNQYPEFVSTQTALFHRKQKALNDEVGVYKESLKILEDQLKLFRSLLKTGDIGTVEIDKLRREIIDIKGQITNKENKYLAESSITYIKKLIAFSMITNRDLFKSIDKKAKYTLEKVKAPKGIQLRSLANAINMDYNEFRNLNKHIKKETLPSDSKSYNIYIPQNKLELYNQRIFTIKPIKENATDTKIVETKKTNITNKPIIYIIKKGDSFESISKKYKVNLKKLKSDNNKKSNLIKIGDKIEIYK